MCIRDSTHTHTHTHAHTHMHTHTCTHTHASMLLICICMHVQTHTHTHAHACTHTHTHKYRVERYGHSDHLPGFWLSLYRKDWRGSLVSLRDSCKREPDFFHFCMNHMPATTTTRHFTHQH